MAVPEGPEIDTDKLRETIDEEIEKEGSTLLRTVALTTAILAALGRDRIAKAGGTVNEALALKTRGHAPAGRSLRPVGLLSAKGLKATVTEVSRNTWIALDKTPPDDLAKNEERYAEDQRKSMEKAKELEKQRDEKSAESDPPDAPPSFLRAVGRIPAGSDRPRRSLRR
jgi:hypothetical protein